jgi:hypothetical protein
MSLSLLLLLVGTLVVLGSCVLPGTGSINVKNRLSGGKVITDLYIYPTGSPDTSSDLGGTLAYNETHAVLGVAPGPTTVHVIIDSGAAEAEETLTVEEGTWYPVWIGDSDILP